MAISIPGEDGLTAPARGILKALRALLPAPSGGRFVKTDRVLSATRQVDPSLSLVDLYGTLLRMVRPWICRYPWLDTQGNFGSVDGDRASGPRFNEISFFEDEGAEIPGLLCNGAWAHSGTWTSMPEDEDGFLRHCEAPDGGELLAFLPPHNLGDVARALTLLLDRPSSTLEDVLRVLPGPDFPTGGVLINPEALPAIYASGKGELRVRSRLRIDALPRGKFCVVISEIPFELSTTELMERIAAGMQEGRLTDIADVRDVSDRDRLRIEVEAARGKDPKWILHQLRHDHRLESTIPVRMIVRRGSTESQVGFMELLRLAMERIPGPDVRRTLNDWILRSDSRRTAAAATPDS
jgi:hypothetical protein